jgi:hypothetical protein
MRPGLAYSKDGIMDTARFFRGSYSVSFAHLKPSSEKGRTPCFLNSGSLRLVTRLAYDASTWL